MPGEAGGRRGGGGGVPQGQGPAEELGWAGPVCLGLLPGLLVAELPSPALHAWGGGGGAEGGATSPGLRVRG